MKTTGFLSTFIAVCSGTEIFPELIKRSFFRGVWHLVILALICSSINVALRLHPFNRAFEECCDVLTKRYGSIEYSGKGITPLIKPDESRSASYEGFRVDYLANPQELNTYRPNKEFNRGIAWTPESVLFWMRFLDGEDWTVFPLLIPTNQLKSTGEMLELYQKASKNDKSTPPFTIFSEMYRISPFKNTRSVLFREFKSNVMFWVPLSLPMLFAVFMFSYIMMNCLLISPIYILFFTSFSYLFGRANMMKMNFPQLYISGIYTGFPGIVIASLYVGLDLPVMDFQSIFLIAYFIYSFAVFARFRVDRKPKVDQDDFDF